MISHDSTFIPERAEETISKLKAESGSSFVRFLVMDQSNLDDVKSAAEEFISWGERLDGLMLNAAVFGGDYTKTKQGHAEVLQAALFYFIGFMLTLLMTNVTLLENNS